MTRRTRYSVRPAGILDMAALQKNASGHLQSLAIHPACFLGAQECDNAADIIGNTDPSQCGLGSDHFLYDYSFHQVTFDSYVQMFYRPHTR